MNFKKDGHWQYENLYAPFDFSINKTEEELTNERAFLRENLTVYYAYSDSVVQEVQASYRALFFKRPMQVRFKKLLILFSSMLGKLF